MTKDLITLQELDTKEILALLKSAATLKKKKKGMTSELKGKVVALIFQKPSNRTRVSFEVGVYQLGGRCIYLNPGEINLGKRETASDREANTGDSPQACRGGQAFDMRPGPQYAARPQESHAHNNLRGDP